MTSLHVRTLAGLLAFGALACSGDRAEPADGDRDLALPPAESVLTIDDQAEPGSETETPAGAEQPAPQPTPTPAPAPERPRRRSRPAPQPLGLPSGTAMTVYAVDTLTSRHNKVGEPAMAVLSEDITDDRGRVVIPSGAVLLGTISTMAPAESPGGEGRMAITFNRVEFGGKSYDITARTDSMGTRMKGRGVTAGDAAKVGAGAVVGAIAGRIIGGNKTGTAVGAAAGAAAGVGIAAATRDVDIILDAGAPIYLVLDAPFQLVPVGG